MKSAADLLPELRAWNPPAGIEPFDWLHSIVQSDHAVAYTTLFWPTFAVIDDHVLREPVTVEDLKRVKKQNPAAERHQREAIWNTLSINEGLFREGREGCGTPLVDERAAYLGRVLAEILELKLARDFPDRRFIVNLQDGTQPEHSGEVVLSFWQEPHFREMRKRVPLR